MRQKFKEVLKLESPLQVVGTVNAYCALLAQEIGFRAIYLSGAGVSNSAFGLPDVGLTTLTEVAEETRRITARVDLPLLVDADTGFGDSTNVVRTIRELERAGASGVHIEDQTWPKRCGHLDGKELIKTSDMVDKLKAALDARSDPDFVIMARTDALAIEGLDKTLERAKQYQEAGVDMIFAEGVSDKTQYQAFVKEIQIPILANMTEFGKTPLMDLEQLKEIGIKMALYPLSAFRAMNQAAMEVFGAIRQAGTQKAVVSKMQTREELYRILKYKL